MKFFTVYSLAMSILLGTLTMHSMESYIKQCSQKSKEPAKGEQYKAVVGLVQVPYYFESPCGGHRLSNEMKLVDCIKSVPSDSYDIIFP